MHSASAHQPFWILLLLGLICLVSTGIIASLGSSLHSRAPVALTEHNLFDQNILYSRNKILFSAEAFKAGAAMKLEAPPPVVNNSVATDCYKPDQNAKDCYRHDPSLLRAWRTPAPINLSALPSFGLGGGLFPGRFVPGPLDLIVCYLSRAREKNAARRAMLRRSFALLDTSTFRVSYYWLLSPPQDADALEDVLKENATWGDIAFTTAALPDGELTNKVWLEMGVAASLQQAPFWAKMDDDAVILWDRFLPTLYSEMPREGLVWCSQGSGQGGLYCTGPYLFSIDVVKRFAADPGACCGGGNIDDWWFPNHGWNNRAIWNFGADRRWHNDDMGQEYVCACKPWTLTSDSIVVHKVGPPLLEAWLMNKTRFALMGQPHHRYGYNVCAQNDFSNPACNHVPACRGAPPAPADCIIFPTAAEEDEARRVNDGGRAY